MDQEQTVLGIVVGSNPYAEKLLQEVDKSNKYSKIVVICNDLNPISIRNMVTVKQDIYDSYYSVLREHKVHTLIHFGSLWCSEWDQDNRMDRQSSINAVDALIESCDNSEIQNLIYISSSCVYMPFKHAWKSLTEEDLDPLVSEKECYELIAENKLRAFNSDNSHIGLTILRPATILGPSTSINNIIESSCWEGMSFVNSRSIQFTHEYDFIDAINAGLISNTRGVFNVASNGVIDPRDIREIIGRRIWLLPKVFPFSLTSIIVRLLTFQSLKYHEWSFLKQPIILATSKLRKHTGFVPKFTSRDAVVDYLYSNDIKDMNVIVLDGEDSSDG